MTSSKDEHRGVINEYFYACCLRCRTTLIQGKNGTDCFIKCPQCGQFVHIIINDDTVLTKHKEI